jgi:gamma-butyrobetaine dioxygenase
VTVTSAVQIADGLQVTFSPDDHQATFTRTWLAGQAAPVVDDRAEDAKELWCAAEFPAGPPAFDWRDYLSRDKTRLASLRQLLSAGIMLLRGVPAEPGAVLDVAATLGLTGQSKIILWITGDAGPGIS